MYPETTSYQSAKPLLRETRIDELLSLIDHTDLRCISISVN